MSPASGARSGTQPSRSERGAGTGQLGSYRLTCGHAAQGAEAVVAASRPLDSLWQCSQGCGLVKRHPRGGRIIGSPIATTLTACPSCDGPRDEPTLKFCATCRKTVL